MKEGDVMMISGMGSQMQSQGSGGMRPQGGPNLDTNSDSKWQLDELETFSKVVSESGGTSFDSEDVMSTYDKNSDGVLDADEQEALASNNAFNLTPGDAMASMQSDSAQGMSQVKGQGGPPPPPPPPQGTDSADELINMLVDSDEDDVWSSTELEDFSELLEESLSTSFDTEAILEKYDINDDGKIDAAERAAIKEDDALNLANTEDSSNNNAVTRAMNAYSMQTDNNNLYTTNNLFDSFAL